MKKFFQSQMNGMNADGREEIHALEKGRVIGCAFSVLNKLSHGFHEKLYENALVAEFTHEEIHFPQQPRFPVRHRETKVGEFIPYLIVFGKVVVDTKTIRPITDHEIGLILNYKQSKLEFHRVVASTQNPIQRKKDETKYSFTSICG